MKDYYTIAQGRGAVGVRPADGGVEVRVTGNGYSQAALVPSEEVGRVVRALRAGESFEVLGGGSILWTRPSSRAGWLNLSAATEMMWCDMQYPSVEIGPKVAIRLAELIEPNPLAGARRRRDDNLREVFGD